MSRASERLNKIKSQIKAQAKKREHEHSQTENFENTERSSRRNAEALVSLPEGSIANCDLAVDPEGAWGWDIQQSKVCFSRLTSSHRADDQTP
jgi:hypothetical protein